LSGFDPNSGLTLRQPGSARGKQGHVAILLSSTT